MVHSHMQAVSNATWPAEREAPDNGEPRLEAPQAAELSRIEVARKANARGAQPKLGRNVVANLIGLDGYRLSRERCERIVSVLREAFEAKGLDTSELTLERLFSDDRPANEPSASQRARRTTRRRPPAPPNERGDGHFRDDAKRLRERWPRKLS